MQSGDDQMTSLYNNPSFNSSFGGTDPSTFQRYQNSEIAGTGPWYGLPDQETDLRSAGFNNSQTHQGFDYSVLGPYMVTQGTTYGQSTLHNESSSIRSRDQRPSPFSPVGAAPRTPADSPSLNGAQVLQYQNSPAPGYVSQYQTAALAAAPYDHGANGRQPMDYSPIDADHDASAHTLNRNHSVSPHNNSIAGRGFAAAPYQKGPQMFTFVTEQGGGTTSESSSFASDNGTGSQQSSLKAIKKRVSGAGTRRPRKPPVETVHETPLQTAPDIARDTPRTASPKRAKVEVNTERRPSTFDSTPITVSPGGPSKAHIGELSLASPDTNPRSKTTDFSNGQDEGSTRTPQQTYALNPESLLHESIQALQRDVQRQASVNKGLQQAVQRLTEKVSGNEGLQRDVQMLTDMVSALSRQHTEVRKDVVDVKCKVLEYSSGDTMSHRDVYPRADNG